MTTPPPPHPLAPGRHVVDLTDETCTALRQLNAWMQSPTADLSTDAVVTVAVAISAAAPVAEGPADTEPDDDSEEACSHCGAREPCPTACEGCGAWLCGDCGRAARCAVCGGSHPRRNRDAPKACDCERLRAFRDRVARLVGDYTSDAAIRKIRGALAALAGKS